MTLNYGDRAEKCDCDGAAMVVCYYERDAGQLRLRNKEKCAQPLFGRDAVSENRNRDMARNASRARKPVTAADG